MKSRLSVTPPVCVAHNFSCYLVMLLNHENEFKNTDNYGSDNLARDILMDLHHTITYSTERKTFHALGDSTEWLFVAIVSQTKMIIVLYCRVY